MFGNNEVVMFDTVLMDHAKSVYSKSSSEMKSIQSDMQSVVEELRFAWKTEAGEKFFEKFDEEWVEGFRQYSEVLGHMSEIITNARIEYQGIEEEARKLFL